jgi:hypothetical protein
MSYHRLSHLAFLNIWSRHRKLGHHEPEARHKFPGHRTGCEHNTFSLLRRLIQKVVPNDFFILEVNQGGCQQQFSVFWPESAGRVASWSINPALRSGRFPVLARVIKESSARTPCRFWGKRKAEQARAAAFCGPTSRGQLQVQTTKMAWD